MESEHRTATERWKHRVPELKRDRMRRGRRRKTKKKSETLESEREESAGCFDSVLPLSAAGREMAWPGDASALI